MFLHHVFPQKGTRAHKAFQNAINDISKENVEVIVTNPILILTPPEKTKDDSELTFLKGSLGFITSELNTGEAHVRQSCA